MGLISTRELLDAYYQSASKTMVTNRKCIDRPELYAYEMKIGKELIDMNAEDILGLIVELRNKRKGKEVKYMISHSSFDQLSSILRGIFNFYIDNYELIRNPFNDKRIKGKEAIKRLSEGKEPFRWSEVQEIITKLHRDYDEDNADYIELILLLFYNGFSRAKDIVVLKPDMINHYYRTVTFNNRTIRLSERCYNLLMKFNKMDSISGWRGDYVLSSWNGSVFKFVIRQSQEYKINERPQELMCDMINRVISTKVNDKYDTKISYNMLYMLGFYEYIALKYGYKKTDEMILSHRDSESAAEITKLAKEYGVAFDNISHLKRYLKQYVSIVDE